MGRYQRAPRNFVPAAFVADTTQIAERARKRASIMIRGAFSKFGYPEGLFRGPHAESTHATQSKRPRQAQQQAARDCPPQHALGAHVATTGAPAPAGHRRTRGEQRGGQ